jgi:endogenous inhibitor of DNA gyrase (YacG/DUF329 family)
MSAPKKGTCVICGQPKQPQFRPFCSKRCADLDLNRWFSGGYAIPAVEEDEPDDDGPPREPER